MYPHTDIQACYDGLTRLDRVMIMPLDVRDDYALEDARIEAESMLDRPMDMVFHCQTDGDAGEEEEDDDDDDDDDDDEEVRTSIPGSLRPSY